MIVMFISIIYIYIPIHTYTISMLPYYDNVCMPLPCTITIIPSIPNIHNQEKVSKSLLPQHQAAALRDAAP